MFKTLEKLMLHQQELNNSYVNLVKKKPLVNVPPEKLLAIILGPLPFVQ